MSAIDRSRAPDPGPAPAFAPPPLETAALGGVRACVVAAPRLEFVVLQAAVGAGHRFARAREAGRAALTADVLAEGTRALDGTALVDALDGLGGTLDVRVDDDEVLIELVVLARHLRRGADLFEDLLFEPRFDPADFERARRQRLARIEARKADAGAVAADAWRAALFGPEHPLGAPPCGTAVSLAALDVEALAAAWRGALRAENVRLAVTGPVEASALAASLPRLAALEPMERDPAARGTEDAELAPPEARRVTVIDRPGSPQTQLRIGHLAVPAAHPDFFPLAALNHPFGGAMTSRLSLNLRERRGWTYGVRSGFLGGLRHGWFQIATAVESGVAASAAAEIVRELENLCTGGVREDEVEFTRAALGRTLLRQYESADAKTAFAANVGKYGWPTDYPARRLAWIQAMQMTELTALAHRHLRPGVLDVVCVGPKDRLDDDLSALGF